MFGGASDKGDGVGMEVCVDLEMRDSFCFEDLSVATILRNGVDGDGC